MLRVTPHAARDLAWWYDQYLSEKIDMAPAFQRRAYIWSKWKQAHLIDSIINGFDVPKFYIANFLELPTRKLNVSRRPYAVIDGKQRFQALFDFLSDVLPLNSTFDVYDDPVIDAGGLVYSELTRRYPHLADRVLKFLPAVMSVATNSTELIDELFVRLNSGESTTRAERRNAMPGPVPSMVRELVMHPFFQQLVSFNNKRMQDFNLAVKLLMIEFKNEFADTKAPHLDQFVLDAYRAENAVDEDSPVDVLVDYGQARDRVYEVLERLTPVFEPKDKLLSTQGQIPIYYWIGREHPTLLRKLRPFLVEFTEEVRNNLQLFRLDSDAADQELAAYYTMSRTTNDQGSLRGRYRILLRRLREFRPARNVEVDEPTVRRRSRLATES